MFNTKHNKAIVIIAAVCLCLVFVLSACTSTSTFKAVATEAGEVSGNGGSAVRYGKYIFYVNGYQSDATAANTYDNTIRVGQIVRIAVSDLEEAIEKTKQNNKSSSVISSEISAFIAEKATVVVPNFYYSNNTTETGLNGIYIFDGRLYYTTPNDELTAGGEKLTSQLVLKSVKLDGTEATATRHHVFTSNSTQIMLSLVGNDVYATYTADSKLYSLKLDGSEAVELKIGEDEAKLSNIKYDKDENGNYIGIFATDESGSICHYTVGEKAIVKYVTIDKTAEGHKNDSLTVSSVNNGYVYYTKTIDSVSDGKVYYTNKAVEDGKDVVFCNTSISGSYGNGISKIYVDSKADGNVTYYNIYVNDNVDMKEDGKRALLVAEENVKSITIDRVVGKYVYYTADGVNYVIDSTITTAVEHGTVVGKGLSTTATGWSTPDALGFTLDGVNYNYVFTLASGSVSVVKFDAEKVTNSTSATITLVEQSDK